MAIDQGAGRVCHDERRDELYAGDGWCVCLGPWKKSFDAGIIAPVRLEATHESVLEVVSLEILLKCARVN